MFDSIKNLSKRAKILLVAALVALVCIGIGVYASMSAPPQPQEESTTETQEQVVDVDTPSENAGTDLSVDADAIRSGYTSDEEEFVSILEANAWAAQDGSELQFDGLSIRATDATHETVEDITYVVTGIDRQRYTAQDATYDVTVAAISLADGPALMRLEHTISQDREGWTLYSDALPSSFGYTRSASASSLTIEGDIQKLSSLIGGSIKTLEEVITDMCALYYPSASSATWIETAEIDWESNTVTTSFTLNNRAHTHLGIVYHMDTGAFECN